MNKELLQQALEALEAVTIVGGVACVMTPNGEVYLNPAISALKAALAHPVQPLPKSTADPQLEQALIVLA
jgi:hypothetical protein